MKEYTCAMCGWSYDEKKGLPEEGIPPGTRFEDLPKGWVCPDCGAGKGVFKAD
ncbi:MAG: rubredoxin [Magnetococcus sp. WYHC-3]